MHSKETHLLGPMGVHPGTLRHSLFRQGCRTWLGTPGAAPFHPHKASSLRSVPKHCPARRLRVVTGWVGFKQPCVRFL